MKSSKSPRSLLGSPKSSDSEKPSQIDSLKKIIKSLINERNLLYEYKVTTMPSMARKIKELEEENSKLKENIEKLRDSSLGYSISEDDISNQTPPPAIFLNTSSDRLKKIPKPQTAKRNTMKPNENIFILDLDANSDESDQELPSPDIDMSIEDLNLGPSGCL
jgi:regulator of replication initiation timing